MATIDESSVPYTLQLCDAIERFTAAAVAQDPGGFGYRGADLRYAVERLLYFALINDQSLYERFARGDGRGCAPSADGLSPIASLLAPYLIGAGPPSKQSYARLRLRSLVAKYRPRRRVPGRSARVRVEGTDPGGPEVFFLVIQPKFITFLLPIAEALHRPYAFLVIDDATLYDYLAERSLPRIAIDTPANAWPRAALPRSLADFPGLAVAYDALADSMAGLRPRCVVVPEGNAPINEVANRAAQAEGVPVLCVQQGWSPIVHSGFRHMTYNRMCVWGEGFADLLRPYNPRQRFTVTGNHAVRLRPPAEAATRRAIGFFLQKGSRLISEEGWAGCLDLVRWTAQNFPESEIRVREHPSAPLSPAELGPIMCFPNVSIMAPATHKLDEVLAGCRIAVSVFSTTILEAAAAGAVPLILNITGLSHYHPDIAGAGAAVEVKDFDGARSALTRLMQGNDTLAVFARGLAASQRRFFANDPESARRAIATEIADLAGEARR